MRKWCVGLLAAGMFLSSGCAAFIRAPVVPPVGFFFTDFKAPLDHDATGTDLGSKQGSSEAMSILGLVSLGDASIGGAAANGNLKTVKHVDYEFFNVLGIYSRTTTRVHGD